MRSDGFGFSAPPARRALASRSAPRSTPGLVERRAFGPNPGQLRMFVHIPRGLRAGAPLVVILHGCGQDAAGYGHGTGWPALADRHGFALLAPEQSMANNGHGCFNWFQPEDHARGHGEAASIRQMIAKAVSQWKLDSARVYITGLSAGGAMTAAMLAAYPEIFAGGAVIAGLPFGAANNVYEALNAMRHAPVRDAHAWGDLMRQASPHQGSWPVLSVWQGDADIIVDPANAQALVAQWRDLQGLRDAPKAEITAHYQKLSWRRDGAAVLDYYTLPGMGHGVPVDAPERAGPFFLQAGIDASQTIADFWGLTRAVQPRIIGKAFSAATAATNPAVYNEPALRRVLNRALKIAGLSRQR